MDWTLALQRAEKAFRERPCWRYLDGTPAANDVPVIAAKLMQDAADAGAFSERVLSAAKPEGGTVEAIVAGARRLVRTPVADEGAWEWCHDACIAMNNAADLIEQQAATIARLERERG
jgi:hypothetical protein